MKLALIWLLSLCCIGPIFSQHLYLNARALDTLQQSHIDRLGYDKKFENASALIQETQRLLETLKQSGFLSAREISRIKSNDSTYVFTLNVGPETSHIYIGIENLPKLREMLFPALGDTLEIALPNVPVFMKNLVERLEQNGYALAQTRLVDFNTAHGKLFARLDIQTGTRRQLSEIVVLGYDKFPKGHAKNISRLYKKRTFNRQTLEEVRTTFNSLGFVSQSRYPELLLSQDSTKIFVYLEKARANRFDGIIGFANDETASKIRFNGYLDLLLVNALSGGETFAIYWKSDGKQQRTFNARADLPYVGGTRFGLLGGLQIFRQDSTFQNTQTQIGLSYFRRYNHRFTLGYQATESSDIQNSNAANLNDFKNRFATLAMGYFVRETQSPLFPMRTNLEVTFGTGSRDSKFNKDAQWLVSSAFEHLLWLNPRNLVQLRTEQYYLFSDTYLISELHRFGGINSVRGFNENSLQATLTASLMAEYRYLLSPELYVHTITDYGYFEDKASGFSGNMLGLGFGFGLQTRTGLLNLVYANGSLSGQPIKLSNSILHLSLRATF